MVIWELRGLVCVGKGLWRVVDVVREDVRSKLLCVVMAILAANSATPPATPWRIWTMPRTKGRLKGRREKTVKWLFRGF